MNYRKNLFIKSIVLSAFVLGIFIGNFGALVRADLSGSGVFPDVRRGTYYDDAIGEMYSNKIITGYDNGRFGPDDYVTRGQVAVMMKRFMDKVGVSSTTTATTTTTDDDTDTTDTTDTSNNYNENGAFRFTVAAFNISEASSNATVTVVRTEGKVGSATVGYSTSDGTAKSGDDYSAHDNTITFADGESSKNISIALVDDEDGEEAETFTITLKNPTGGSELSDTITTTITILDNDGGSDTASQQADATAAGRLGFSATDYAVPDSGGDITITVNRTEGTAGAVAVNYATTEGTAESPNDYADANGTLNFAAGETSKTFKVSVADEDGINGNSKFNVHLSNPTGEAVLGTTLAEVTIVDDEITSSGTGSFKVKESEYTVTEGENAVVTVQRIQGFSGEASVDFATTNGTAKSGFDYDSTSGTLTFKTGETSKTVIITTLDDDNMESSTEAFTLTLSNPTNGAGLDSQKTASIVLSD